LYGGSLFPDLKSSEQSIEVSTAESIKSGVSADYVIGCIEYEGPSGKIYFTRYAYQMERPVTGPVNDADPYLTVNGLRSVYVDAQ
jgi:hypothetical protein